MAENIINEEGINGTGKGFINTNSKDFKALQAAIQAHAARLSPQEKRENLMLSTRFQMESYLKDDAIDIKAAGVFVKELIKLLGITNQDLARYVECEESNMSAFLNGKRRINTDLAIKLGQIFKFDPTLILNIQNKNDIKHLHATPKTNYKKYDVADLVAA